MSIKLPKIFLDSGDPEETRKAKGLIGTIDGQTTNPSLVAKNPDVQKRIADGKKLTKAELLALYKEMIEAIEKETAGPVSVEVYADWNSTAKDMLEQAADMATWGNNIYMKFPAIPEGIKAAQEFTQNQGGRVNMTLVFDQQQAAAVFEATKHGSSPSFISPFIGRWDDRGYNGMDLIKNIGKQYRSYEKKTQKESHVRILAASIRNLDHLYASIYMGVDAVTIPYSLIQEWIQDQKWVPDQHYRYDPDGLKSLIYQDIPMGQPLESYTIDTEKGTLLDEGLQKFVKDWNNLLG